MIIIEANGNNITAAIDTIQGKALMHILQYVLENPDGAAENYAAKKMSATGLDIGGVSIGSKEVMIMVGQIAITLGRILTHAEVAAMEQKEVKKLETEDKAATDPKKTKEGEWKN